MKSSLSVVRRNVTLVVVVGLAVCFLLVWLGRPTKADSDNQYIQYNFSQTQTHINLSVTSSHMIKSTQWRYAGPLEDTDNCSNRNFNEIPDDLKAQADIKKSKNNLSARIQISISKSNNDKYYCFLVEGYPIKQRLDYNPPTIILLTEGNRLSATDVYRGPYTPAGIDSSTWHVAVFDFSKMSDDYACNAENDQLTFRPITSKLEHVGRVSYGNTTYLNYYVPDDAGQFLAEFFENLKDGLFFQAETNPALIPFVDGELSELFTDNIHLCHYVSDSSDNKSYQLMRLDLGGPVVKLTLQENTIRASSPAVDLDDTTWQYLKITDRRRTYICDYADEITEPTAQSAVVEDVENGDWYCFWVADKKGHIGKRLIKVDSDAAAELPASESVPVSQLPTETVQGPSLINPPVQSLSEPEAADSVITNNNKRELLILPADDETIGVPAAQLTDDTNLDTGQSSPLVIAQDSNPLIAGTADSEDSSSNFWLFVLIGVGVVGISSFILFKFVFKKKAY